MQDLIQVSQLEFKKAYNPTILTSGGLGPCIAIGFYHTPTKSGYMLHWPDYHHCNLDEYLHKITQDYQNLSDLQVYAAGSSIDSHFEQEDKDGCLRSRKIVKQTLQKYFLPTQLKFKWMKPNSIGELVLYTSTGRFTFTTEADN